MKAAVLTAPETLALVSVPDPTLGIHDVLVKIGGVGVCGSDLALYRGSRKPPRLPWIMGHEGVGEIVAVGAAVTNRALGQQVAIEPNYCCFCCPACLDGRTSACRHRVILGMNHPGVLSQYVAVPARFAWPVSDRVAPDDLVCAEPMTVAHAAMRRSGIGEGQECLVVGAGSQGLFLCQALLSLGARPYVQEPHDGRRELAQRLGAEAVHDAVGDLPYLFETSGAPSALTPALRRLAENGTAMLIGMNDTAMSLSTSDLVYRQLTLTGSLIYDHPRDFATTVEALDTGHVQPGKTIAARYPFDDVATAFADTATISGKLWIEFPKT
ncbi:MAG: zinc-dependent alcohol dehydrogenase [Sciscionella sp.]